MTSDEAGYKAFQDRKKLSDNPHRTGNYQSWCDWADGWLRAKNEFEADCKTPSSEGRLAYQLGGDQSMNPHPRGTMKRYRWKRGFEAAEFANEIRAKGEGHEKDTPAKAT